jgi:L-arabinokinase
LYDLESLTVAHPPGTDVLFSTLTKEVRRHTPSFFTPDAPVTLARAPGRLDVMGGVADYSGSVVLEYPLAAGTGCALQWRDDGLLRVRSDAVTEDGAAAEVAWSIGDLQSGDTPLTYGAARARLGADPAKRWAAYVLGAFVVLQRERGLPAWQRGANILVTSDLPLGAGVASSASVEVAAMSAVLGATDTSLDGAELGRLCQIVENHVVGAPCGIMDQMTCALGRQDALLALKCQPAEVLGHVPLPPGVAVFGICSGVKHSVGGSRYTRARCAAFMGLACIESWLGRTPDDPSERSPTRGYLCNLTPQEFYREWRERLPRRMPGTEFLGLHSCTTDTVTTVDPTVVYPVAGAVEHAIYENHRVQEFIRILQSSAGWEFNPGSPDLERAGRLMYASHWSYGCRIGLGAPETDLIVRLARRRGVASGIYGAKITGGGSGGTVAVLARADARSVVEEIAQEYARETGRTPRLLEGSSPGAVASGIRHVTVRG